MISAPRTNSRRERSSVNLPAPARPDNAPAVRDMPCLLRQLAASGLDRGLGASGRSHALQRESLGHSALHHDLGALGIARHQLGGAQGGEVDITGRQRVQLVQQHFDGVVAQLRPEADLRQATLHRHLATFETGLDLALAGTRERTLVATAASLAEAGTDAATDAASVLACTVGGLECIELH